MFYVRRLVSGVLARASVGAVVAVLAAAYALAQPATRHAGGLRPAFEDTDEFPRRVAPRTVRKRDTRLGAPPNTENPDTRPTSFGNPPGFGAAKTGFISTNKRRPPAGWRKGVRAQPAQSATQPAPLSLTPPGISATTGLPATAPAAAKATPPISTKPAVAALAPTAPRNPLVRIPDGTPTGGIAGTVNTAQMTVAQTTLLRRRTAAEEDAFAQLGLRTGAFVISPAVEVFGGYDTNPARAPAGRPSAFVTVSPELLAKSDRQRHQVTATLRGSYPVYGQTPELDRPSADGKITGRLDVTRDTALIGEGTLVVGTDNPGSPNVQAGPSRLPLFPPPGGRPRRPPRFNRVAGTVEGTGGRPR